MKDYEVLITLKIMVEAEDKEKAEEEVLSCALEGLFDSVYKYEVEEAR